MHETRRAWFEAHPYLAPVMRFQRIVEEAAAEGELAAAGAWAAAEDDPAPEVPLLGRPTAAAAFSAATAEEVRRVVERLAAAPDARVAQACRSLREEVAAAPGGWGAATRWVLEGADPSAAPVHGGLFRLLAWTVARRLLAPALADRARRGEEGAWDRGDCPTCGALPAMAQLLPAEAARRRLLVCGCCGTRWAFRRIGCPFCGNDLPERMTVLQVEGDERLRLDVCDDCGGYVKTYAGEGEEELFLADWPTLHLDLSARDRGLRRAGASLYELPRTPEAGT